MPGGYLAHVQDDLNLRMLRMLEDIFSLDAPPISHMQKCYFAGTMCLEWKEDIGSLYSFELDGTIRLHKEKVTISNGIAWSSDNKTMYYIDSTPRKIWRTTLI